MSSKPRVRDLSRQKPSYEELAATRQAFSNGTPLASAILGQSIIEHELETILRTKFKRRDDNTWLSLTSEAGPLNTFSAKISAGYGFGVYDHITSRNLNNIRDIRNAFAHSKRNITFNEHAIVHALKTTSLPANNRLKKYKELKLVALLTEDDPRDAFIYLCNLIFIELLDYQLKRIRPKGNALSRLYRRKTSANPFVAGGLGQVFAGLYAPSSEANRNDGPTGLAPRPVPPALLEALRKKSEGGG